MLSVLLFFNAPIFGVSSFFSVRHLYTHVQKGNAVRNEQVPRQDINKFLALHYIPGRMPELEIGTPRQ